MKSNIQDKSSLVDSVFTKVFKKYDLMNDIISFGVHRSWKEKFIDWMNPQHDQKLIDVASGTGDIARLFLKKTNSLSHVICVEPNKKMLSEGKIRLKNFKNLSWVNASAEKLPLAENTFDIYSISYGIRNVSNINNSLKEAYRVLKPGGRFMCLEFSKINNEIINFLYKKYSKTIPYVGKLIAGDDEPYKYLVNSIDSFYSQEELKDLIFNNGFENVEYRNLSYGISAIHSGWKI